MGALASGVELASAYISLTPSMRGFGRETQRQIGPIGQESGRQFGRQFGDSAGRSTNGIGKKLGAGFGKAFAAGGAVIAAAGIGSLITDSLGEAREAQKVGAATESIVKATGGAANLSAKQIGDLSGALSTKIGVDDEAIQSGANLLLTFKNVRDEVGKGNDVFTRATAAGADLAAAGFGSIEGNAKQLGKALNDPIKGISALGRAGVTFTEGQKKQIKGFVKSNDLLSAQKIILREVENQVGGTAEATATSGEKAAVAFGNLKESLGTALLPLVDRLATAFVKAIPKITAFATLAKDKLAQAFAIVKDKLEPLRPIFDKVTSLIRDNPDFVKAFAIALGVLAGAIGLVTLATAAFSIALNSTGIPLIIIGIAALIAGLVVAYKRSDQFREIVDKVGAAAVKFGTYLKNVVLPAVVNLAQTVGRNLKPVFDQLAATFVTKVLPVLQKAIPIAQKLFQKFQDALPTILKVAQFIGRFIGSAVRLASAILGKVLPVVIRFAAFLIGEFLSSLVAVIRDVGRVIAKIIEIGGAIGGAIGKFAEFATGVAGSVAAVATSVSDGIGTAVKFVTDSFDSLVEYVTGLPGKIGGVFDGLWSGVANSLRSALNNVLNLPLTIPSIDTKIPGVGKIGGQTLIPALAKGTSYFGGGVALVGERGPELVTMPRGSRVDTAAATARMARPVGPLAAGAGGGGTAVLSVDGESFRAYLEWVAQGVVETAQGMADQRSRAQW